MTFDEWLHLKEGREALERNMIELARQIAKLPEDSIARKALEEVFKNLLAVWEKINEHMKVPDGPVIKAAPPPRPGEHMSEEERERMREAAEQFQHALYELFRAMRAR